MMQEERLMKIIDFLEKERTARFSDLAALLQVSEGTVRKDLTELDRRKAVKLVRGGAVLKQDDLTRQVSEIRDIINKEEKQQLVKALADLVVDGQAIALNGGTTTVEAAKFLAEHYSRLTIITNNLSVLDVLREKRDFTIILASGGYYEHENTIVGKQAETDVASYNADLAILAVNAISLEKGITDFRMEERGIINAMIQSAQKSIVVADHSKFERIACINVCPLEKIMYFVTDSRLDEAILHEYQAQGADVVQAKKEGAFK